MATSFQSVRDLITLAGATTVRTLVLIVGGDADPLQEAAALERTMMSLAHQTARGFDVLVIDVSTSRLLVDSARELAVSRAGAWRRRDAQVEVAWSPGASHATARDEVLLACDADVLLPLFPGDVLVPDAIQTFASRLTDDPELGAVYCSTIDWSEGEESMAPARSWNHVAHSRETSRHGVALRVEAARKAGGFQRGMRLAGIFPPETALLRLLAHRGKIARPESTPLLVISELIPHTHPAPRRPIAKHPGQTSTVLDAVDKSQLESGRDFWRRCQNTFLGSREYYATQATHLESVAEDWIRSGDRVLDVGCGNGVFTRILSPFAREVVGIDLSPALIGEAQAAARITGADNLAFVVGDALGRLPTGPFDVVTIFGVLSTVADAAEAKELLQSVVASLADGGAVLFRESLSYAATRLLKHPNGYLACYRNIDEFHRLLTECDLVVDVDEERLAFGENLSNRWVCATHEKPRPTT